MCIRDRGLSAEGATGERGTGGSLASLRAIREKKGVSLEQASEDLELSVIYLEFIEGGHIERLPGPGYARSMLTMYAEYLGLDSAKVLSRLQLEECFASPAFEPPTSDEIRTLESQSPERIWTSTLGMLLRRLLRGAAPGPAGFSVFL